MMDRRYLSPAVALVIATLASACMPPVTAAPIATGSSASAPSDRPPALSAIDTAQLRRDLYTMASDAMRGREAGTLDELRASAWVADRAREAGLLPAGDDGTYFQFWPMHRLLTADNSHAELDGAPLELWKDAAVVTPVDATLDLPLVWVGKASNDSLTHLDLRGRAVAAIVASALQNGIHPREWERYQTQMRDLAGEIDESFVPKPPEHQRDVPRTQPTTERPAPSH